MSSKIGKKILAAMLCVSLIPLLLIYFYITDRYSTNLRRETLEQNYLTQQGCMDMLNNYLMKIEMISNTAYDANTQLLLKQHPQTTLESFTTQIMLEKALTVNLDLYHVLDSVELVAFYMDHGSTYQIGDAQYSLQLYGTAQAQRTQLEKQYKRHRLYQMGGTHFDKLLYLRAIYDTTVKEKEIGVMGIVLDKSQIAAVFDDYLHSSQTVVSIQDSAGDILFTNEPAGEERLQELEAAVVNPYRVGMVRGVAKTEFQNPDLELTVTFYSPVAQLLMPLRQLQSVTVNSILLSVALILVLSLGISNGLVRPILKLKNGLKDVQSGDFGVQLPITDHSETGELCVAFNNMSKEIDRLMNKVYATQLSEKEAIIASLTSQINPHFLYNTLDMIKSMAEIYEVEELSQVAKSLSAMFRYSIQNDCLLVSVKQELGHLANYIKIIQVRFGDKLQFETDVDEEVLDCSIIKVCLQPLVENAINHGLFRSSGRGKVAVRLRRHGDRLEVTVEDNGVGMTEEVLKSVGARLSGGPDSVNEDKVQTGVGLKNIHQRIHMYYGNQYGLQLESQPDKGTIVKLSLPYELAEPSAR